MGWNDSPEVRNLAIWAKRFGYERVVAVVFTKDGKYGYVSYGRNSERCKTAKDIAEQIYDAIASGAIEV